MGVWSATICTAVHNLSSMIDSVGDNKVFRYYVAGPFGSFSVHEINVIADNRWIRIVPASDSVFIKCGILMKSNWGFKTSVSSLIQYGHVVPMRE